MKNEINEENKTDESLVLDALIKKYSYLPENKDFEIKNIKIEEKANFINYFKQFFQYIRSFDQSLTSTIKSKNIQNNDYIKDGIISEMISSDSFNDNEIKEFIKDFWINQKEYNIKHIVLFLILADKYLEKFSKIKFSEYDKNIIYWTILFHDLGKHKKMNPLIEEKIYKYSADKTHPFKSIIIFLDLAFDKNLFYYPNENYKDELFKYYKNDFSISLYKSWELITPNKKKKNLYNISFMYIEIFAIFFNKIKMEEKNEWIYDICVLIIFHQSLPNNDNHMNKPLLEEKDIKRFFTKRLVELMRVIMIYDSASHSLFNGGNWCKEINKHIDEIYKSYD